MFVPHASKMWAKCMVFQNNCSPTNVTGYNLHQTWDAQFILENHDKIDCFIVSRESCNQQNWCLSQKFTGSEIFKCIGKLGNYFWKSYSLCATSKGAKIHMEVCSRLIHWKLIFPLLMVNLLQGECGIQME